MVITIVQIPRSGPQPDKATAIEGSRKSAPIYRCLLYTSDAADE